MRFWWRLVAAAGAVSLFLAAVWLLWQAGLPTHEPLPEKVQPFQATTLDNRTLVIDETPGRPFIMTFWATWCQPCIVEMPILEAAYRTDDDLLVIGINAGMEEPTTVQRWIETNNITFPIVMDKFYQLERLYQVPGLPTTLFIDRDGNIRLRVEGAFSEEQFEEGLAAIGARRP
jgi:thiol-disulfide isomerase/thioredoxin